MQRFLWGLCFVVVVLAVPAHSQVANRDLKLQASPSVAFAQADGDRCAQILSVGIINRYHWVSSNSLDSAVLEAFCNTVSQSSQNSAGGGGGFGFKFLQINGEYNSQRAQQPYQNYCVG
jgi:hypothetical protein